MNLGQYKILAVIIAATVVLFFASPVLSQLLTATQTTSFTEFSLLGSDHNTSSYPYSIKSGQSFTLYLEVDNHLGSVGNYLIQVKFRDPSDSAPDSFSKTSSTMPSLYNIPATVDNQKNLEIPLIISLNYVAGSSTATLVSITVNGDTVNGNSIVVSHDSTTRRMLRKFIFRTLAIQQYDQHLRV